MSTGTTQAVGHYQLSDVLQMGETGNHNPVGVGALGAIREVGLSLNF